MNVRVSNPFLGMSKPLSKSYVSRHVSKVASGSEFTMTRKDMQLLRQLTSASPELLVR